LSFIPVAWSLLGVSAVWSFGVHADLVLPAAGALLVVDLIRRRSHVMKKLSFAGVLAVLVAMLLFVPASSALAQASQHEHAQQAQKGGMKMDQMKMGEMKMDGKMMEEMAAKKKANTERITALMATVKSATGEAKVSAMADVVAVLLEERAAMQEHCAAMMAMMKK
jgi:mannitol-specific phosphotransferase system IIBC component